MTPMPDAATRPRVFVTRAIPDAGLALLRHACDVTVWPGELPPSTADLLMGARDCDAVLALLTDRMDAAFFDACPQVRVVSNMAVGYDNIDVGAATARGIAVGNTPGILTETTADLAFALLLAVARRLPEGQAYVRADAWQTWGPLLLLGRDVHGATLGIVGLGEIGTAVARRARGFGMRVLYSAPRPQVTADVATGARHVSFEKLLAMSDFISIHAPLNEATRGLFNHDAFTQMKPHAILINTARGPIVDTDALVEALQTGTIAAAALDVTDPEPLRASHPLAQLPNCLVTPHIASASLATRGQMATLAARNILAGLRGIRLPACVNPDASGTGRQAMPQTYVIRDDESTEATE
jgi:glyoxylate reductase